jgi:anthranilate synthase component 1
MSKHLQPHKDAIITELQSGNHALLWTKIVTDMETPVSAMQKLLDVSAPTLPCFLLESVQGGESRGRYSLLGLYPDMLWKCEGGVAKRASIEGSTIGDFIATDTPPLVALHAEIDALRFALPPELPSLCAGMIGYFGYDMIKLVEAIPHANPDPIAIPQALLMRPTLMLIFDNVDGVMYASAPLWQDKIHNAEEAYTHACALIERTLQRLATTPTHHSYFRAEGAQPLPFTSNMEAKDYMQMVERAKEYILAGDIFQVVPSQRFSAPFSAHPFDLYRALRHRNPSPFLFYLQMQDFALVGSSPEILVRLRDDTITIRPIAGTRKRGSTSAEDYALEQELLGDPKELAEHQMLLDLGRNDVGKCAMAGSVKVTQHMTIERYSHVMHIVSNVEGTRRPDANAIECLMAGFPAGTVSGAPKIRAMEIIDELEPVARSFYAGGVGYFSASGWMDSCITLRTALVKDGVIHVQAGGGVVADSDPLAEYEESCNKAKAVMTAAAIAEQLKNS